tara:strand:- start:25733 stop:26254 length:522 start_codon:yes stop_codon:yes gene_type:complete
MGYILNMETRKHPMQNTLIFDLDHTVIDSSHRQRLLPCGGLDLDHWIENRANRDLVFADQILPLADYWRAAYQSHNIVVCTSRVMSRHDWEFLRHHGLQFDDALHRAEGDTRSDAPYKVSKLQGLISALDIDVRGCTFYEDHAGVREAVSNMGVYCIDPVPMNKGLAPLPTFC